MLWLYYAVLAAFLAGFADVTAKKVTKKNKNTINITLVSMCFIGIFSFFILCCRFKIKQFDPKEINDISNIVIYAIIYVIVMILFWLSIKKASNPGFTRLFYATNIIFTFLISCLLLKTKISLKIIFGILITFIGLSVVVTSYEK